MQDMKRYVLGSHKPNNFVLFMLATGTAAFWCLNIYVMFHLGEGMVLQKLAAQSLAWLQTICFIRAFDE